MNAVENRNIVSESKALTAITLRESAEELLKPFIDEFLGIIPDLSERRRTYDGRWVIGVQSSGGRGDPGYTRLDFELVVDAANHTVTVTVKSTTFNRDHPTQSIEVSDGENGMRWLGDFFETVFLLFAGRYFEAASNARAN
mgnify:CR=1 FL=1